MQFTLTYRGPLKANGSVAHKHEIRQKVHQQLKILWQQPPLKCESDADVLSQLAAENPTEGFISLSKNFGGFRFVPLVSPNLHLVAELSIAFLRPEVPGAIVTTGGDIDNRLKTLFDSLRMPKQRSELPRGASPTDDEKPFFCLLEDDNLITRLSVVTDRLLEPVDKSQVLLLVHVALRATQGTVESLGLG